MKHTPPHPAPRRLKRNVLILSQGKAWAFCPADG